MPITHSLTRSILSPLARGVGSAVGGAPFAVSGAYTAVIGDSIDSTGAASWFDAVCRVSGQRMRQYLNKGVGGNTTAQMLTRINADVIAQSPVPNVCIIGGPTNDHGGGVAAATTQSNIQSMVAALRAAGITPAIRNCPSTNVAGGGIYNTIALRRQAVLDHNAWLATYCAAQGIALFDIFTPTYDTTGLNPSHTADGVHLNSAGCLAAASYVSARLPGYINSAKPPYLAVSVSDPLNAAYNGVFIGDSNSDGYANGWSQAGTSSPSLVAGDVGNWQQFTTAGGVLGYITPYNGANPTVVGGRVYEIAVQAKADADKQILIRLQWRDAGDTPISGADSPTWASLESGVVNTIWMRATAPANAATVFVALRGESGGATGQISVARFAIYDKTANP